MDELARRFAAAAPEAVIIATPHGTLLDDRFGVVRAARLSEHASRFVEDARLYDGPGRAASSPTPASPRSARTACRSPV